MLVLSEKYFRPIVDSAVLQGLILAISSIIMCAEIPAIVVFSIVAYWVGAITVMIRRRMNPTKGDLLFVRFGFLLVVLVIAPAIVLICNLAGLKVMSL